MRNSTLKRLTISLTAGLTLALAACGQTGPLYLPQRPAGTAPVPPTSTPATSTTPASNAVQTPTTH